VEHLAGWYVRDPSPSSSLFPFPFSVFPSHAHTRPSPMFSNGPGPPRSHILFSFHLFSFLSLLFIDYGCSSFPRIDNRDQIGKTSGRLLLPSYASSI
jgi:hypothetical protein